MGCLYDNACHEDVGCLYDNACHEDVGCLYDNACHEDVGCLYDNACHEDVGCLYDNACHEDVGCLREFHFLDSQVINCSLFYKSTRDNERYVCCIRMLTNVHDKVCPWMFHVDIQ